MPIPAVGRLRQKDQEFKASLDYIVRQKEKRKEGRKEGKKEGGREGGREEGGREGGRINLELALRVGD
jgi:hypothetical protein